MKIFVLLSDNKFIITNIVEPDRSPDIGFFYYIKDIFELFKKK
jgi:hypothetical protein